MINCPYCGKLTDPKLENCPHCGGPMRARAAQQPQQHMTRAQQRCPQCGAPVQDGDIICTRCGTNLLTGQKIAEEQKAVVQAERRRWPLIALLVLVVLALAAVAAWYILFHRDAVAEASRLSRAGDNLQAINILEDYVESHPQEAQARFLLGKLYWRSQNYAGAANAFEQTSKLDPANDTAGLLTVAALNQGGTDSDLNRQTAALRGVVESHPDNQQAWYLLALALGSNNDYAGEMDALQHVTALDTSTGGPKQVRGLAEALNGKYDQAAAVLADAQKEKPDNADVVAARGFALNLGGKVDEGMGYIQEAIDKDTSIGNLARVRLALLYMAQGDNEKALPLLREAHAAGTDFPAASFFYALALQNMGLDAEALTEYDRLVSGNTNFAGDAAVQMALIYMNGNNPQKARELLTKALGTKGNTARVLTIQGRLWLIDGDQGQAQSSFMKAVQTDPSYPAAHLENGLLYVSRGIVPEGVRELERYVALVGADNAAARTNEIELLISQLKQTMDNAPAAVPTQPAAPAVAATFGPATAPTATAENTAPVAALPQSATAETGVS